MRVWKAQKITILYLYSRLFFFKGLGMQLGSARVWG